MIVATVASLAVAGGVIAFVVTRDSGSSPQPELSPAAGAANVGVSATEANCKNPERPTYQGFHKVRPLQSHPAYSSKPPASGWYRDDGAAGYYEAKLPVEAILGMAARGGINIWTNEAESRNTRVFYNLAHRNDVIAVKDPSMTDGVTFVAWGYLVRCKKFSGAIAFTFLDRYSKGKSLKVFEPTAKSEF